MVLCRSFSGGSHQVSTCFKGIVSAVGGCYVRSGCGWPVRWLAGGGVVREAGPGIGLLWQDDTD